jgi:hypothetical protein
MIGVVDVRVPKTQVQAAITALEALASEQFVLEVDANPPAAGPEAQITVQGVTEDQARQELARGGVTILASRTRQPGHPVSPAAYRRMEQVALGMVTAILAGDQEFEGDFPYAREDLIEMLVVIANVTANVVRVDSMITYAAAKANNRLDEDLAEAAAHLKEHGEWERFVLKHWQTLITHHLHHDPQ